MQGHLRCKCSAALMYKHSLQSAYKFRFKLWQPGLPSTVWGATFGCARMCVRVRKRERERDCLCAAACTCVLMHECMCMCVRVSHSVAAVLQVHPCEHSTVSALFGVCTVLGLLLRRLVVAACTGAGCKGLSALFAVY